MNHFIPQIKLLLLKSPQVAMVSVKLIITIHMVFVLIRNSLSYFVLVEEGEKEGWGRLEEVAFWSKKALDATRIKYSCHPS